MNHSIKYDNRKWQENLCNIRQQIDNILNASKRNPKQLIDIINSFRLSPTSDSGDWSTVPPEGRLEILSAINASADNDLLMAWASQKSGIDILEVWLKGSIDAHRVESAKISDSSTSSQEDVILKDTFLLSLLQMLRRIPITIEILKNYSFARKMMQINKSSISHHFSDSVNVLAGKLVNEWRQMVRLQKTHVDRITNELSAPSTILHDVTKYLPFPVQFQQPTIISNTSVSTSLKHWTPRSSRRLKDTLETPKSHVSSGFQPQQTPTPMATSSEAVQPIHRVKPSLKDAFKDMNTRLLSSALHHPEKERKVKQARFASDGELCRMRIFERLE